MTRDPISCGICIAVLVLGGCQRGSEPERESGESPTVEESPVDKMARQLVSEDVEERRKAAEKLCEMGDDARPALDSLITAATDDDKEVREWAQKALIGRFGPGTGILPVEEQHIDVLVRMYVDKPLASDLLGRIGSSAVPALIELGHEHGGVGVVKALGTIGPPAKDAVPLLVSMLDTEPPAVWPDIAFTLGQIGHEPERCLPVLRKAYQNAPDEKVETSMIVRGMAAFGPRAASETSFFVSVVNNPGDKYESREAIRALVGVQTPEAFAFLVNLYDHHRELERNSEIAANVLSACGILSAEQWQQLRSKVEASDLSDDDRKRVLEVIEQEARP